jgi:hypothetical protein
MMKRAVLMLIAPAILSAQQAPAAKPDDVSSMDAIVGATYDVISGPKGQKRDWDRLRSLCYPGARFIPARPTPEGGASAIMLSVEDFIKRVESATAESGFFESEIRRETQAFGNIAHVFSTYESRRVKGDKPFARGINSFQLLKDGQRWWVITIFWDSERPGNPLPDK